MKRVLLLLLPALLAIVVFAGSSRTKPTVAPAKDLSSVATLAPATEPGTRLIVSGKVWDPTGTRGVPGVRLKAHHTDAKGVYNARGVPWPRLQGTVVTDSEGRFEWRTIRPMPYPGGGNPAHIHIEATGGGMPRTWYGELLFSGDRYLSEQQKAESKAHGRFGSIVTPAPDANSVLRATLNIRLSHNQNR